jgi:hypothetical protein
MRHGMGPPFTEEPFVLIPGQHLLAERFHLLGRATDPGTRAGEQHEGRGPKAAVVRQRFIANLSGKVRSAVDAGRAS